MSSPKVLFGFHAVGVRLKTAPQSIVEIYYEATRRDARMRQFLDRAREAGARLIEADSLRIAKLAGRSAYPRSDSKSRDIPSRPVPAHAGCSRSTAALPKCVPWPRSGS